MRLIGSLIKHLRRWIVRYKVALDHADARERRGQNQKSNGMVK